VPVLLHDYRCALNGINHSERHRSIAIIDRRCGRTMSHIRRPQMIRRLTRLCRAAGLRTRAMLADALLLFEGSCVMVPSGGRAGTRTRFIHLSEAMIAGRTKKRIGTPGPRIPQVLVSGDLLQRE